MLKLISIAFMLSLFLPFNCWSAASVAVSVTAPSSSSGAVSGKSIVKSMIFSPCVNAATDFGGATIGTVTVKPVSVSNFFDQLNIKITGSNDDADKDKIYDYDLYFFLVNTGGTGSAIPTTLADYQFYVFRRYNAGGVVTGSPQKLYGVDVTLRTDATDTGLTNAAPDMLLRAADFSSATINEVIFGGDIFFDGYSLPQGTWLAVAILSKAGTALDLNEPKTWAVWDAVPFILGTPWKTTTNKTCQ